jgi:competence protein ComGC
MTLKELTSTSSEEYTLPLYKMKIKLKKKAQEEMVGLVLIMLVVAVIFVIFLGIFIKKGPTTDKTDSEEISQFLDAALKFSVEECAPSLGYIKMSNLITECYRGTASCTGPLTCKQIIEEELTQLAQKSWRFTPESPEQGYEIVITEPTGSTNFVALRWGTSSPSSTRGAEKLLPTSDGAMKISLKISLKPES